MNPLTLELHLRIHLSIWLTGSWELFEWCYLVVTTIYLGSCLSTGKSVGNCEGQTRDPFMKMNRSFTHRSSQDFWQALDLPFKYSHFPLLWFWEKLSKVMNPLNPTNRYCMVYLRMHSNILLPGSSGQCDATCFFSKICSSEWENIFPNFLGVN